MHLAHHKTFPTVKDQCSIRGSRRFSTAIFAMVRNSVSKHIPKSQYPLRKAPIRPLGVSSTSLSCKGRAKFFSLSLSCFFRQVATIILNPFPKVKSTRSLALILFFLPLQIEYAFLIFNLPAQLFFAGKIQLVH